MESITTIDDNYIGEWRKKYNINDGDRFAYAGRKFAVAVFYATYDGHIFVLAKEDVVDNEHLIAFNGETLAEGMSKYKIIDK